jgi:hypothetical protein
MSRTLVGLGVSKAATLNSIESPPRRRRQTADSVVRNTCESGAHDVLAELAVGSFIERKFATSHGVAWFRGQVIGFPRGIGDKSPIFRVRWLNGDQNENVVFTKETIRVLGLLEVEPPPIRTRMEEREMHEEERIAAKDPFQLANSKKTSVLNRAVEAALEIVIDSIIETTLNPIANGTVDAALCLQAHIRKKWWRQSMFAKWSNYIHTKLPAEVAASALKTAERHLRKSLVFALRRPLPAELLISPTEISEIGDYVDSSIVDDHNSASFDPRSARRFNDALTSLMARTGELMRGSFKDHERLARIAEGSRCRREKIIDPRALNAEATATLFLAPMRAHIHAMAAPSSQLARDGMFADTNENGNSLQQRRHRHRVSTEASDVNNVNSGFVERQLKLNSLFANSFRLYSNPHNLAPVFKGAGRTVSGTLTASQMNIVHDNWGVLPANKTSMGTLVGFSQKMKEDQRLEFDRHREDNDVHGFASVSDNFGTGSKIRYETTTQHTLPLKFDSLPTTIRDSLDGMGDAARCWAPMLNSGFHASGDLLASPSSDELLRLNAIMTSRCIDEALPGNVPSDLGPAPARAAVLRSKRQKEMTEANFFGVFETGMLRPVIKRDSDAKLGTRTHVGGVSSMWKRGRMLLPQRIETYAKVGNANTDGCDA